MNETTRVIPSLNVGPDRLTGRSTIEQVKRLRAASGISAHHLEKISDFFTVSAVLCLVLLFIENSGWSLFHSSQILQARISKQIIAVSLASFAYTFFLNSCGTYSLSGGLLRVRETACLIRAVFLPGIFLSMSLLLLNAPALAIATVCAALLLFPALVVQKSLLRTKLETLQKNAARQHRVLIYGLPDFTRKLDSAIRRSPKLGMLPVASIDSTSESDAPFPVELSVPMFRAHGIDTILIAHPHLAENAINRLRAIATEARLSIYFMAGIPGEGRCEIDHLELDGQLLYGSHELQPNQVNPLSSRLLDLIGGGALLAVLSLPMLLAALLVRLSSPGPIFFRQVRIGQNGQPFTIYKFRTMHEAACGDSVSPVTSTDPRITSVGRILRKTSFDELPQLFNVVRGEMALVGPRPEMGFIVADYKKIHRRRLMVKPGLTGLWQISEHRAKPIHENIEYDLYYLKYKSLSLDIAVLLHTMVFAANGV